MPNNNNVFLDIIFSNITNLQVNVVVDSIFVNSLHHISYLWSLTNFYVSVLSSETEIFNFANGNYHLLNDYLASVDWKSCFVGLDVDDKASVFFMVFSFF